MRRLLVDYSNGDGIARIRLDRADRLNVLDVDAATDFETAVNQALADDGNRVVVVTGKGPAFCAGGDLRAFQDAPDKVEVTSALLAPMHRAILRLAESRLPVIGGVHGTVAGGGMSLALSFDLLVAADDARFNMAYVRIGGVPDCGGSWYLPRIVGLRKALEIALLAETVDAEAALSLGLVNRVVPVSELEAEVVRLAARLAAGPAKAQGHIKALMRSSGERELIEQLQSEAAAFADCAASPEFTAGLSAFFARKGTARKDSSS